MDFTKSNNPIGRTSILILIGWLGSIFQYETHLHIDSVFRDRALLDDHFLISNPGTFYIPQCFIRPFDTGSDGIVKTFIR